MASSKAHPKRIGPVLHAPFSSTDFGRSKAFQFDGLFCERVLVQGTGLRRPAATPKQNQRRKKRPMRRWRLAVGPPDAAEAEFHPHCRRLNATTQRRNAATPQRRTPHAHSTHTPVWRVLHRWRGTRFRMDGDLQAITCTRTCESCTRSEDSCSTS